MTRVEFTLTSGSSLAVYAATMRCVDKQDLHDAVGEWRPAQGRDILIEGAAAKEFSVGRVVIRVPAETGFGTMRCFFRAR